MLIINRSQDNFTRSAGRQLLWLALAAVVVVVVLMLGLSWASSLTGAGKVGKGVDAATGTLTLVLLTEPPQLDSTLSTDAESGRVLGHVMEGLLRPDEHNRTVGGVAERWEITDTGATFWLRPNARWSDGKPVTAHDFVFAWRKAVDPKNASEYASILFGIRNAEAVNQGKLPLSALGVRALDDRTLRVELARPVPYFETLMSFAVFNPIREDFYRATAGRYGSDADTLLYNGPFIIKRWVHGAHLRLEKNPLYWNPSLVKIKAIDFPYFTSDANAEINLFKDKKIAMAAVSETNLDDAMAQGWKLNRFMDGSVFYMEFNHRKGRPTDNRNLRKAIQLALDPGELVYRVIKMPGWLPGQTLFPIWLAGVEGPFRKEYPPEPVITDPAAARGYLERAKRELGVKEIPPLMMLSGDSPLTDKQAEYYQETLKRELGLNVRIDRQIFKQRLAKMAAGEFDMVLAGWNPDYADPLTFGDLFASWNLNNRGRYNNPALDRYVAIAQNSTDPRTRMDAFGEIQKILIEDAVVLPNYERARLYVTDPRITGLVRRVAGFDPDYTHVRILEK